MQRFLTKAYVACTVVFMIFLGTGCGEKAEDPRTNALSGRVAIDGSSTVFPITEAVAEDFQKVHKGIRVTVGISGTGGGFQKFISSETDINDASRPIKESELLRAKERSIEFIELPVAFDGLTVVVNPKNEFVESLTVEELRKIWQPGSTVKKWNDVRPEWPDQPLALYGPGTASGTFDYFTEAINGEAQASRPDFTASEDDNVLVQGIAGDEHALGFFGFAYYVENRSLLKLVAIDGGKGPIAPSNTTINDGTYQPLSRPLFIYVSKAAAERPPVAEFVAFYLQHAPTLVKEVGYVPLPDQVYELALERFKSRRTGSVFSEKAKVGISLGELLGARS